MLEMFLWLAVCCKNRGEVTTVNILKNNNMCYQYQTLTILLFITSACSLRLCSDCSIELLQLYYYLSSVRAEAPQDFPGAVAWEALNKLLQLHKSVIVIPFVRWTNFSSQSLPGLLDPPLHTAGSDWWGAAEGNPITWQVGEWFILVLHVTWGGKTGNYFFHLMTPPRLSIVSLMKDGDDQQRQSLNRLPGVPGLDSSSHSSSVQASTAIWPTPLGLQQGVVLLGRLPKVTSSNLKAPWIISCSRRPPAKANSSSDAFKSISFESGATVWHAKVAGCSQVPPRWDLQPALPHSAVTQAVPHAWTSAWFYCSQKGNQTLQRPRSTSVSRAKLQGNKSFWEFMNQETGEGARGRVLPWPPD